MTGVTRPDETAIVSGRLAAILGLLDEFSGNATGQTWFLIERIEQIGSSRTQSGIEPGGSGHIAAADLVTVLSALDQAADRKRDRAANCSACSASPADLCGGCEIGLARADDYEALLAKLGGAR